jgi:NAD(P)H dehydrogenase (quinone)
MTIAIIGATGKFGKDITDAILERGVDASYILALGRDSGRLEQLAALGL